MNPTQNFLFLNLDTVLSDSTPENFASIWKVKWNWMRSLKFETVRIHFLSDVFGLWSSGNFATMATRRNDLSSLLSWRLVWKGKGKVFYGVKSFFSWYIQRAYHPRMEFFQPDTFLGFGCYATTVSDVGIWHDSSSESSEVRDVTAKLGPILRSAR